MIEFKSYVEIVGQQHNYREQHHWESRAAHIFNHLWREVLERLPPLPDISGIPFNPLVPVNYSDQNGIGGMSNVNFAIITGFPFDGEHPADLTAYIPDAEESFWKHGDLDIFRHELIHCYQHFFELAADRDYCEAQGIKLGGDQYQQYRGQLNQEEKSLYSLHHRYGTLLQKACDRIGKIKSQRYVAQGGSGDQWLTQVYIPEEIRKSHRLFNRYCDRFPSEKDMVYKAGEVWTPDFSYDENLWIYHNSLMNVFKHSKLAYQQATGRLGTRQQLEKLGVIDLILNSISTNPLFRSARMKSKLRMMLKDQYNHIEKAEKQLEG